MPAGKLLDQELLQRRTGLSVEDLDFVCSCEIFAEICRKSLCEFLIDSAVHEFPRNSLMFMQGDPARRFYLILEGWVKVFRETQDGHETVMHVFSPGETFAEAAIFEAEGYPACASACVDTRVLGIPAESFKARLMENRALFEHFISSVNKKLLILTQQLEQFSARSATERLAGFLCDLCPSETESTVMRLPLEKAVIAAMLGMQPETFSRSISKLRAHGVEIDGDLIFVDDISALRDLSGGGRSINAVNHLGGGAALKILNHSG
jgi:CRP-like cAMP-binding protein